MGTKRKAPPAGAGLGTMDRLLVCLGVGYDTPGDFTVAFSDVVGFSLSHFLDVLGGRSHRHFSDFVIGRAAHKSVIQITVIHWFDLLVIHSVNRYGYYIPQTVAIALDQLVGLLPGFVAYTSANLRSHLVLCPFVSEFNCVCDGAYSGAVSDLAINSLAGVEG